jgi:hypothetical protein
MGMKLCLALVAAAFLTGCAALTANAPLFTPADQVGPAPLNEGIWIQINEKCTERNAQRRGRLPAECFPAELRRDAEGAWIFSFQDHVRSNPEVDLPEETPRSWRLIIAPATERQPADSFVPLYLAEYVPVDVVENNAPHYAIIVPVGTLPAQEMYLVPQIGCTEILRDGPIEGIAATRNDTGTITSCIASEQAAVREAARRATIENLSELLGEQPSGRFLFVRP